MKSSVSKERNDHDIGGSRFWISIPGMPLDTLPATGVRGAAHVLLVEQRMPSNPLQVMTNIICIASQFTPPAAEGEWQAATRPWTTTLRCAQVLPLLLTSCTARCCTPTHEAHAATELLHCTDAAALRVLLVHAS